MAYAGANSTCRWHEDASNLSIKTAIVCAPNLYSNAIAAEERGIIGIRGCAMILTAVLESVLIGGRVEHAASSKPMSVDWRSSQVQPGQRQTPRHNLRIATRSGRPHHLGRLRAGWSSALWIAAVPRVRREPHDRAEGPHHTRQPGTHLRREGPGDVRPFTQPQPIRCSDSIRGRRLARRVRRDTASVGLDDQGRRQELRQCSGRPRAIA